MIKYFEPNKIIADLGCGLHKWQWPISDVVRYDCREIPGVTYSDFNEQIDLGSKSVDYSLAVEVIEHLENPLHFLREIKRVTKKRAIITHPDRFTGSSFYSPATYDSMGHITILSGWLTKKHLEKVGFKILHSDHVHYKQMVIFVVEVCG